MLQACRAIPNSCGGSRKNLLDRCCTGETRKLHLTTLVISNLRRERERPALEVDKNQKCKPSGWDKMSSSKSCIISGGLSLKAGFSSGASSNSGLPLNSSSKALFICVKEKLCSTRHCFCYELFTVSNHKSKNKKMTPPPSPPHIMAFYC